MSGSDVASEDAALHEESTDAERTRKEVPPKRAKKEIATPSQLYKQTDKLVQSVEKQTLRINEMSQELKEQARAAQKLDHKSQAFKIG